MNLYWLNFRLYKASQNITLHRRLFQDTQIYIYYVAKKNISKIVFAYRQCVLNYYENAKCNPNISFIAAVAIIDVAPRDSVL